MEKGIKIASVLTIIFILIYLGGCLSSDQEEKTQDENSDAVVLQVYILNTASDSSLERMSEAISKITMEKIGCEVQLHSIDMDNYWSELQSEYINGNEMDVFAIYGQSNLNELVDRKWLFPLNEMIDQEDYSNYIKDTSWNIVTFEQSIYALPSNQSDDEALGIVFQKDICENLQINLEEIKDLDDVYEVLCKVRDNYPDIIPLGNHYGKTIPTLGQDSLGDNLGVLLNPMSDPLKVENLYESDIYYEYCKRMYKWYEEGLIIKNGYNNNKSCNELLKYNEIFAAFRILHMDENNDLARVTDKNLVGIYLENSVISTTANNLYWGIGGKCRKPEMAAKFLNLLYTDEELIQLCVWGEEKTDYYVEEGKYYIYPRSREYLWNSTAWVWPNGKNAVNNITGRSMEFYNTIKVSKESPANGFVFKPKNVSAEVVSCRTVVDKYNNALLSGYLNPDEGIPLFLDELKEAGIDKVIEEKQKQLDEWKIK